VRSAAVTTFLVALALGLGLAWARGPLLLALGLASIAVAVAYNLGPLPLSQTPWGEAVVFCVMGPLETAVSEVAAVGYVTWAGLAASLPVGALVAGILLANNVRDLEPDRARGRTTLPMVLGAQASLVLFTGLAATALAFPAAAYLAGWLPASSMLAALAAPEAATVVQALARGTGLSRAVPLAARLELTVGLLLALGLAWAAVR
jgi:1,4-dihydroxy-2-naphthoate octaprenyltransferase